MEAELEPSSSQSDPCSSNLVGDETSVIKETSGEGEVIDGDGAKSDEGKVTMDIECTSNPELQDAKADDGNKESDDDKLKPLDDSSDDQGKAEVVDEVPKVTECNDNRDNLEQEEAKKKGEIEEIAQMLGINNDFDMGLDLEEFYFSCAYCPGAKFTDIGFEHHLQLHQQILNLNGNVVEPLSYPSQPCEPWGNRQPLGYPQQPWGNQQPMGYPQQIGYQQPSWASPQPFGYHHQQQPCWANPQQCGGPPRRNQPFVEQQRQPVAVVTIQDTDPEVVEVEESDDDEVQVLPVVEEA